MSDRPAKLPALALNVLWASKVLTLGEVVVCYHDWALDQGGADGSYISHESLSARLGGKLTAATISRIRQRLKRLTLHEPLRRRDARNLGWVTTLPRQCLPHTYREVSACAVVLDGYLTSLTAWSEQSGRDSPGEVDARVQPVQTPRSNRGAAALGGRGAPHFSASSSEAQLPSAVREKGVSAYAPKAEKGEDRDPAIVRAEGMALIRLQQGKMLTPEEKVLVQGWLDRHPPDRYSDQVRKAVGG